MKCHEARQLFFLYHDSELDSRSAEEINLHLEGCSSCRDVWSRERRLEAAVASAASRSAGETGDFPWDAVAARLGVGSTLADVSGRDAGRGRWIWRREVVAAAVVVAVILSFAFLRPWPPAPTLAVVARSAVEHHEKYLAGLSPVLVRGPAAAAVRNFFAGELGFEVLVPDSAAIAAGEGHSAELVGARRCTFLGGPVAFVSYRISDGDVDADVTVILGPLKPPESVVEAISQSADGIVIQEIVTHEVGRCRVLIANVRGVLFVAAGTTEPTTLRRLVETFQSRRP